MITALFVETDGCYFNLPGVDPWDEKRDARKYYGPAAVVAHPPCQRWGRMATGGPSAPNTRRVGDDGGCFGAALSKVREFGGVIEHPADSLAWKHYNILKPNRYAGWQPAGLSGRYQDFTCYVEQGHYGHISRKPTWLYVCGIKLEYLPELNWDKGEQRIHPVALAKHGYEKARRIGMTAMIGGKDKTKIRNATPIPFRDVLLDIARKAIHINVR